MARAEAHATQGDSAGGHGATGEPSVSSSLEHLVGGSQGVITKRIDLGAEDWSRHDIAEKVGEIGDHLRAQAPQPAAPANPPSACPSGTKENVMSLLLLIILLLLVFGGLPNWGYHNYGYGPSGVGGIILIIVLILFLTGRLNF